MISIEASAPERLKPAHFALSGALKARTELCHDQAETLLGLPGSISSRDEYAEWLIRFWALYDPIERAFCAFSQWSVLEPFPTVSAHSERLIRDLHQLGFSRHELTCCPEECCPIFPTFAHALGARYVLEGSTLGGKVILRELQTRIGSEIFGATDFFEGGGVAPSTNWRVFKTALDRFDNQEPERREDVLEGAEQTFHALLNWFEPFVAQKRRQVSSAGGKISSKPLTAGQPVPLTFAGQLK